MKAFERVFFTILRDNYSKQAHKVGIGQNEIVYFWHLWFSRRFLKI
jgi:hypothetical protein